MHNVNVRHLRYLIAVADEGGLTQAAQRLSMTQPAVSRAVQALERTVGATLVERGRRGTVLTAAGRVLVDRARVIVGDVESAMRESRAAAVAEPALRVSAQGCELPLLRRLAQGVGAEVAVSERAVDVLRSGGADLALVRGPYDDHGLDCEVLESRERVAVVPAGHPAALRPEVSRAELAADPVIGWPVASPAERAYWWGADGFGGEVVPGPEVRDLFHLFALVGAGEAIAFLPARVRAAMAVPPDVRLVPVADLPPEQLRLVWPADETSPAVARFVRHATSAFEPL